jgi:hypothetical protein
VDDAVPGVAGVVDDVVDLAAAELGGFLDQDVDVVGVGDVAGDGDGPVGAVLVDGVGDGLGAFAVDVANDDFAAFVGEEAGCFGADALAGAGDAGRMLVVGGGDGIVAVHGGLAGQHTLRVVQVARDLLRALSHGCDVGRIVVRGSSKAKMVGSYSTEGCREK